MNTLETVAPNVADADGFYWEARVSASLGIPRKELARLRKKYLSEGSDFQRKDNNAVALTAQGLAKIEAQLRTGKEAVVSETAPGKPKETTGKPGSDKKSDVPLGPPAREKMTVERVPQNIGLLLCITHTRSAPISLVVRVRENTNFAQGMILEAIESYDGVWQFRNRVPGDESTVGRLPRGKGKW